MRIMRLSPFPRREENTFYEVNWRELLLAFYHFRMLSVLAHFCGLAQVDLSGVGGSDDCFSSPFSSGRRQDGKGA